LWLLLLSLGLLSGRPTLGLLSGLSLGLLSGRPTLGLLSGRPTLGLLSGLSLGLLLRLTRLSLRVATPFGFSPASRVFVRLCLCFFVRPTLSLFPGLPVGRLASAAFRLLPILAFGVFPRPALCLFSCPALRLLLFFTFSLSVCLVTADSSGG
jgi:hypothetical protein